MPRRNVLQTRDMQNQVTPCSNLCCHMNEAQFTEIGMRGCIAARRQTSNNRAHTMNAVTDRVASETTELSYNNYSSLYLSVPLLAGAHRQGSELNSQTGLHPIDTASMGVLSSHNANQVSIVVVAPGCKPFCESNVSSLSVSSCMQQRGCCSGASCWHCCHIATGRT